MVKDVTSNLVLCEILVRVCFLVTEVGQINFSLALVSLTEMPLHVYFSFEDQFLYLLLCVSFMHFASLYNKQLEVMGF